MPGTGSACGFVILSLCGGGGIQILPSDTDDDILWESPRNKPVQPKMGLLFVFDCHVTGVHHNHLVT